MILIATVLVFSFLALFAYLMARPRNVKMPSTGRSKYHGTNWTGHTKHVNENGSFNSSNLLLAELLVNNTLDAPVSNTFEGGGGSFGGAGASSSYEDSNSSNDSYDSGSSDCGSSGGSDSGSCGGD